MPEPASGISFGRYRLVQKLGDGGMAVVYRAIVEGPEGFSRPLVIKRILPELSRDPKFVKMFLSEAKLCARLHHPGIVQVQSLGEVSGEYFLAMELVDGLDLATALKRAYDAGKPMPPGVACYLASEISAALAYAHALADENDRPLEIVHRDVSPSNIMVTRHGQVKLLDFGIARAAAHARSLEEKTRTGTLKGKVSYMAPEQAEGLAVDRRADLFAVGIVLYECLTLERLFRGEDDFETLRLVREAKIEPPSLRHPEIDPAIDQVILRLLARTPEGRFHTGDEVVTALQPIIHRLHGDADGLKKYVAMLDQGARPEPVPTTPQKGLGATPSRADTMAAPRTLTGSSGEIEALPQKGGRARSLGFAAVAVAGLAALLYSTRSPPPPAPAPAPQPVVARPAPPPAPVEEKKVRIEITGVRGAEVFLDEKWRGNVPLKIELPLVKNARTLVVQHPDYEPLTRTIDGSSDLVVEATLQKAQKGKQPALKVVAPKPAPVAAPKPPAAPEKPAAPPPQKPAAPPPLKPAPPVEQPEIKDPF